MEVTYRWTCLIVIPQNCVSGFYIVITTALPPDLSLLRGEFPWTPKEFPALVDPLDFCGRAVEELTSEMNSTQLKWAVGLLIVP